ncbi:MAG: hypothetical protein ACR5KX_02060 [Wolbachia sp.]
MNRLARELVKVIFGEKKSLNLKNELLKTYHVPLYHVPLIKEVFDKKSGRAAGKIKWYCEFKKNFTKGNNLSKEAKLL